MVKSLDELRLSVTRSSLLTNPLFLTVLFIISMAFILYVFISYYTQEEKKQYKTYLNADLTDNNYLFDSSDDQNDSYQEKPTLEQCIQLCDINTKCDGMTYNEDTQKCLLTEEGKFRDGTSDHYAWQKPSSQRDNIVVKTNILKYANKPISVSKYNIPPPRFPGSFCYSFWINITDWYTNSYGYWKHIFHKGSHIENNRHLFKKWSDIKNQIPEQMIGVWLAPYNNTLRICYNFTEQEIETGISSTNNITRYSETNCYIDPNTKKKKCVQSIASDPIQDIPQYINANYIELYSGKNFTKHKTRIYIQQSDLQNTGLFSSDKLHNLDYKSETLSSIKIPYRTKLKLIASDDSESEILDQNIPDLSKLNFDNKMTKFKLLEYIPSDRRMETKQAIYDISNIEMNIPTHILINFNESYFDVHIDGKLFGTQNLQSLDNTNKNISRQFKLNNGDLYAKYPTTFSGSIYNLGYVPEYLSSENIKKLYNQKPSMDYDKIMNVQTLTLENFTSNLVNNVVETDITTYDN